MQVIVTKENVLLIFSERCAEYLLQMKVLELEIPLSS